MKAPAQIETSRLFLRTPTRADAEAIFERYASAPAVTRFLAWPTHRSAHDTLAFLEFCESEWLRWPAGPYLMFSLADGRLLGSTGLNFKSPTDVFTGYVLAQDSWGQGYATEALTAMIELARQIGVRRLSALCHPEHRASRHVLEKCRFELANPATQSHEFPNLAPGVRQNTFCYELPLVE